MDTIKILGAQLDSKSAFLHTRRLQFLPICKDAGLTTKYNLFLFYP